SMLVTTAIRGRRCRKERSLSSTSATKCGPRPSLALPPNSRSSPPTAMVGSRPARSSTKAIMAVVVVLPWVPATAMPNRPLKSRARSSPREMMGMPRSRAATTSGLTAGTALETTTVSGASCSTWAARWPMWMRAPKARKRSVAADSDRSEPDTATPWAKRIRARPLMPAPPMPMKWTFCCDMLRPLSARPAGSRGGRRRVLHSMHAQKPLFLPSDSPACPRSPGSAASGPLDQVGDVLRRLGPCQGAAGHAHARKAPWILHERAHLCHQPIPVEILVLHDHRRTGLSQRPRIGVLVTLGCEWVRHQDRRQTAGGDLGQRDRPGSTDHQVRGGVGRGHVVDVGHHVPPAEDNMFRVKAHHGCARRGCTHTPLGLLDHG